MTPKNKIEICVPDKYFYDPTEERIIGLIRYLKDQGKACEFLGFNSLDCSNNYVVLIDGVKYYVGVSGTFDTNYYATFFVVGDAEHDYTENHLNKRVNRILNALEDR